MPNLDKTGPQGRGEETGRGLGNCDDDQSQETRKGLGPCGQGLGKGRNQAGQGRGMGRGLGRQVNLEQLGKEASGEKSEEK